MAKRTKKSSLKVNPYKAHAQDETEYGTEFIDLPGGITGGVAQLVEAKVSIYKEGTKYAGEKFVYFGGVVVEPKVAINTVKMWKDGKVQVISTDEVEIKGQRTGMTLPLCDTTKADGSVVSEDENVAKALNELRKIGGKECTMEIESEESLVQVLEALKEGGPFFKFSTTSSTPNEQYPIPRVWENWFGAKGLEDYELEEEDDVDETDSGEEKTSDPEDDPKPDVEALAKTADEVDEKGDVTEAAEDAQRELSELAKAVGVNADDIDSWIGVSDAIMGVSEGDEPKEGGEEWAPQKEEAYMFKPPRARKALHIVITTVNEGAQTVTAKALESGKVYKAVAWSKLEDV